MEIKAAKFELLAKYDALETNRLLLRPFTLDDIDAVYAYAGDPIVTKYLTFPAHPSKEESRRIIEEVFLKKDGVYAIELKKENICMGAIDVRPVPEHNKMHFGYALARKYWNQGYMTEALGAILDMAFTKLETNRVESTHYVGNEGSGRVMQKCGMKYEGTGKRERIVLGRYVDVVHYAILREDYLKKEQ